MAVLHGRVLAMAAPHGFRWRAEIASGRWIAEPDGCSGLASLGAIGGKWRMRQEAFGHWIQAAVTSVH